LSSALGGAVATLVVKSGEGATLLAAESENASRSPTATSNSECLDSTTVLPERSTMILTLRQADRAFTRRDQHLVERASTIFAAWLPAMLKRSTPRIERRSEHREFEQVLDRTAAQIIRDGIPVSVLVLSVANVRPRPGPLQTWVSEIRAQLRGSDLAGTLSEDEIGVLLSGTPNTQVPVVCARLKRRLGLQDATALTIGVASREAGSSMQDSIVLAARKEIFRRRES
jgi:hypothetical protein